MKKLHIFTITAAILAAGGCALDYPNNANHQNVDNDDCIQCHINRERDDAPKLPKRHLDKGNLKSRYKKCKNCHDQQK